jgi:serine protease AprX
MMLEANPLLTPDQVVTILRQQATPMPYEERVVGAGYVDAHNAVRAALNLAAVPHPANLFPSEDPNAPQSLMRRMTSWELLRRTFVRGNLITTRCQIKLFIH